MALFFLAVLLNMNRVWMYYFIPAFPFAAVGGGWLISIWYYGAKQLVKAALERQKPSISQKELAGGGALFLAFLICWYLSPALEKNLDYYDGEVQKSGQERIHSYTWRPGLVPNRINEMVRSIFWSDDRVIGKRYSSFTYYLWHESRIFDIMDKVVEKIQEKTHKDGEIFGDSGTVPLFALLAERRIAANEVDTNIQRYKSGNADPGELIRRIDTPKTEMIILRNRFGVALLPEVRRLVAEKYEKILSIRDGTGAVFYLFLRRGSGQGGVR
jgi:hypothetical protein